MPPQPSETEGLVDSEPGRLGLGVARGPGRGIAALLVCVAVAAVTWLALLPHAGQLPAVRAMIDRNNSLGVDPSAKFYSELPAMPGLIDQVRDARRR